MLCHQGIAHRVLLEFCGLGGIIRSVGAGFVFQMLKLGLVPLPLLSADPDMNLLATSPAPGLPPCLHAPCHDENGLYFEPVSMHQLNVFLYKNCHGHGVYLQQ